MVLFFCNCFFYRHSKSENADCHWKERYAFFLSFFLLTLIWLSVINFEFNCNDWSWPRQLCEWLVVLGASINHFLKIDYTFSWLDVTSNGQSRYTLLLINQSKLDTLCWACNCVCFFFKRKGCTHLHLYI